MRGKMRIAICDDIEIYREYVKTFCQRYFGNELEDVNCFASGDELLNTKEEFDLLFLDIEMPGMDGISVKNYYEMVQKDVLIIFLTSHQERVREAFGKNVFAFLDKPMKWDDFAKTMDKVCLYCRPKTVGVESCGKMYAFVIDDIRYVEAKDKYTNVVTEKEEVLIRKSMKDWEELLGLEEFCRINRSYLVNFRLFNGKSNEIQLKEDKCVVLSRKNRKQAFELYRQYLQKKLAAL